MEISDVLVTIGIAALLFSAASSFVAARQPTIRRPLYRVAGWGSLLVLGLLVLALTGVIKTNVSRVWDHGFGVVNLQVFTDSDIGGNFNDAMPPVYWRTSVHYSEGKEPGTWHWIEKA